MSQDWFARKLAEKSGRPVMQPQQLPPTQPRQPGALPAHMAPYAVQPTPSEYGSQGPVGTPEAAPVAPQGQQFISYDANTGAQVADDGHVAMLYNAAAQTGGSRAAKAAASQCPECGGTMFARDRAENGMPMRTPAMPQCVDCGYPVVQSGSRGGALGSAKGSGPARMARQLPPQHQVTVMDGNRAVTFQPPTSR